ncbi:EAL domain-containing protein [Eubacterium oxidoreducens]|uniref:Diguanylate cyclase (GGDEF) domain-containing protein n=1 Tax=Eubacterium oxidoreducens TaxID=1732 RepID=A0A1G6C2K4_EUBOX|nr:GGDEF domain-containing phosphodiesterase [Eubacterium oxidoreducens]SDB27038.1 diguanylate cyclase (GGDEF) domain-containing protein [Eubacterium oxidoreducens]
MISKNERIFYENLQLPLVLFDQSKGKLHAELISDGLCNVGTKDRETFLNQLNHDLYHQVHPADKLWLKHDIANFLSKMNDLDVVYRNKIHNGEGYRMVHLIGKWQPMNDGSEMVCFTYYDMMDPAGKLGKLFSNTVDEEDNALFRDTLTGLHNVMYFRQFADERLQLLLSCEKQPVLIYININSLHDYNSQYGYSRGDDLLRLYASLIKEYFPDAMIARAVDDQFVLIDEFSTKTLILDNIKTINHHVQKTAYGKPLGIRVGICIVRPNMTAAKAVDYARIALKNIGDDLSTICNFYSQKQDEQYKKRRYILEHFNEAMEQDWIQPFYHGIVRTTTHKFAIFESLARWIDPVYGTISPAEFIPILSHFHLLHELDFYMVEHICRDLHLAHQARFPLSQISINFSAQDFDHADVVYELNTILQRYNIPKDFIIVEITEQDIARATDHFHMQLEMLREEGYELWLDDFGSDYSSLSVFSQFTFDRIKFDMKLIHNLDEHNQANRRILRLIVNLCKELGIHTLAEGVETQEQLQFLQDIDCELVQGYLFHKPCDITTLLNDYHNCTDAYFESNKK